MTASKIDLTVITNTWQRPKHLACLLRQLRTQSLGNLRIEHLVVSDGPDVTSAALVEPTLSRFLSLPEHRGCFGVAAKDFGIEQAGGEYVCFWDDDNIYEPHALTTAYAAAFGFDIGIVRTEHWSVTHRRYLTLPREWTGQVRPGDIDTMCLCVRTQLARRVPWDREPRKRGMDHRWLSRLMEHQPRVNYVPLVVGRHLTF